MNSDNSRPDRDLEQAINMASSLFMTAVKRQWQPGQKIVDQEELNLSMKQQGGNVIDAAVLPLAIKRLVNDKLFKQQGDDIAPTDVGKRMMELN